MTARSCAWISCAQMEWYIWFYNRALPFWLCKPKRDTKSVRATDHAFPFKTLQLIVLQVTMMYMCCKSCTSAAKFNCRHRVTWHHTFTRSVSTTIVARNPKHTAYITNCGYFRLATCWSKSDPKSSDGISPKIFADSTHRSLPFPTGNLSCSCLQTRLQEVCHIFVSYT